MSFILRDLSLHHLARFGGDPNGYLLIFQEPNPDRLYFMGIDVGTGKGLSNSVIHVIEQGTIDGPDVQVAEFACDFLDPHELAAVVDKVGHVFWSDVNDLPAEAIIEVWPGPGEGTQYDLMTYYEYPNIHMRQVYDSQNDIYTTKYGWYSNTKSRKQIILWGEHQLKTGQWKINSPWFLDEMRDFTIDRALATTVKDSEVEAVAEVKATARARKGRKDDRILAGMIAEWAANSVRMEPVDPAVARDRQQAELVRAQEQARDFQNTSISFDEMMDMW